MKTLFTLLVLCLECVVLVGVCNARIMERREHLHTCLQSLLLQYFLHQLWFDQFGGTCIDVCFSILPSDSARWRTYGPRPLGSTCPLDIRWCASSTSHKHMGWTVFWASRICTAERDDRHSFRTRGRVVSIFFLLYQCVFCTSMALRFRAVRAIHWSGVGTGIVYERRSTYCLAEYHQNSTYSEGFPTWCPRFTL